MGPTTCSSRELDSFERKLFYIIIHCPSVYKFRFFENHSIHTFYVIIISLYRFCFYCTIQRVYFAATLMTHFEQGKLLNKCTYNIYKYTI